MTRVQWIKQTVNPTNYTKQSINPTNWSTSTPPTSFLLSQNESFLLQQNGGYIGLQQ